MKHKIQIILGLFVALLALPLFKVTTVSAAGICYTSLGDNQVGPDSTTCSVDPSGRTTYKNQEGVVIPEPLAGHCYAGLSSGSGSFVTITYTEYGCSDLETLRNNRMGELCTASNGDWIDVPPSSTNNFTAGKACSCPEGQTVAGGSYQCSTPAPAGGEGSGESLPVAGPDLDCQATDGQDLTGENCQIVATLNTAFNLVSGLVSLAVIGNIIYGGIQYSMAQGDPGAASKAKTRIRNAIVAFLMYLSLYGFIQWLIPGGVF